jgi:ribosomal protein RSM22 (predicted rRNA methylase)
MIENEALKKVHDKICPGRIWELPAIIKNLIQSEIRMLPRKEVSEQEGRCPTTSAGMRSFLDRFFVRHYFQIQNAIVEHFLSGPAIEQMNHGRFQVLDIGSGPAVGILAVTEIIKILTRAGKIIHTPVQLEYTCVEPSEICRRMGLKMANRYFARLHFENKNRIQVGLSDISVPFPDCLDGIKQSNRNQAGFQLIVLSYVLNPLFDAYHTDEIQGGMEQLKSLLTVGGKILVVQDQFSEDRINMIASMLGVQVEEQEVTQRIYSNYTERKIQTYRYYTCRFGVTQKGNAVWNEIYSAAG